MPRPSNFVIKTLITVNPRKFSSQKFPAVYGIMGTAMPLDLNTKHKSNSLIMLCDKRTQDTMLQDIFESISPLVQSNQ